MWLVEYMITKQLPERGDEVKIAGYLKWQPWTIILVTAVAGIYVATVTIFKFIPKRQRLTFITAGILGGVSGFILWMIYLGKILMPDI